MNGQQYACPTCGERCRAALVGGIPVGMCTKCHGFLLSQPDLVHLLEALSGHLMKTFDPDTHLRSVMHNRLPSTCPSCNRLMEQADYCSAGIAGFERCETCGLLRVEADQLGAMTLMWTRMDARQNREDALNRERMKELDNFVDTALLSRAVSGVIAGGLLP
jgi:Zn-finger nucleic acid-binding protein